MARWALVTGPKGSKKGGALRAIATELAARGLRVGGFVQESEGEESPAIDLLRIADGERLTLARTGSASTRDGEEPFCSFIFDNAAFDRAASWLDEEAHRVDVLVVDEVSKLEASKKGHFSAVARALALEPETLVLLAVRSDQLFAATESFHLEDDAVASLELPAVERARVEFVTTIADDHARQQRALRRGEVSGVDFIAHWRARQEAARAQEDALLDGAPAPSDPWEKRAPRFRAMNHLDGHADPLLRFLLERLRPGETLLDIGAGTGRYALPLALQGIRVVAVEPSPSMRAGLEAEMEANGVTNVEVVDGTWPLDAPPRADVVLAAHVLYGVRDIERFVLAMHACARRACVLAHGVRAPRSALSGVFERVRGATMRERPGAFDALGVLLQLGIFPSFVPLSGPLHRMTFRDREDARDELTDRLHLTRSKTNDELLDAAIAEGFTEDALGCHAPPAGPDVAIWWTR